MSTLRVTSAYDLKKYFCVSTDKAANPVNMMGASKRIMELFLMRESELAEISFARFANVAFSDGSLLHGFNQRLLKKHPITAPKDVLRYFITPEESGELCLLSCILGSNNDIFIPKLNDNLQLTNFADIARRFIENHGYKVYLCQNELEARSECKKLIEKGFWPCYFFNSDTSGEKSYEEFYTKNENVNLNLFEGIGVVNNLRIDYKLLDSFDENINGLIRKGIYEKSMIVNEFEAIT